MTVGTSHLTLVDLLLHLPLTNQEGGHCQVLRLDMIELQDQDISLTAIYTRMTG